MIRILNSEPADTYLSALFYGSSIIMDSLHNLIKIFPEKKMGIFAHFLYTFLIILKKIFWDPYIINIFDYWFLKRAAQFSIILFCIKPRVQAYLVLCVLATFRSSPGSSGRPGPPGPVSAVLELRVWGLDVLPWRSAAACRLAHPLSDGEASLKSRGGLFDKTQYRHRLYFIAGKWWIAQPCKIYQLFKQIAAPK